MTYLTAYRSQSRKHGNGGTAFKTPPPYKPPTKPGGANDNAPRPANDNLRKLGLTAKGLRYTRMARLHPFLNIAKLVVETAWPYSGELQWPPGGTVCCQVPRLGPPLYWGRQATSLGTGCAGASCAALQAIGSSPNYVGRPLPTLSGAYRILTLGHANVNFPQIRQDYAERRFYPTPLTQGLNGHVGRRPYARPIHKPWTINPFTLPIQQPMPLPLPLPMPLVSQRMDEPLGRQTSSGEKRQPIFRRVPPRPGDKEKKIRATAGFVGLVQRVFHGGTEALDALDAIHDALPKKYQAKGGKKDGKYWKASPQAKLNAIYKYWDQLDLNEAVKNLIINHLTDEVVGRIAGRGSKEASRTGVTLGPTGAGVFFGGQ